MGKPIQGICVGSIVLVLKVNWKTQMRLRLEHLDRSGAMEADYPGPQGLRMGQSYETVLW